MRLTRLIAALLLLASAACTTNPEMAGQGGSLPPLIIDQPTSPYPYNSRFW
jgi:hypothetical protein